MDCRTYELNRPEQAVRALMIKTGGKETVLVPRCRNPPRQTTARSNLQLKKTAPFGTAFAFLNKASQDLLATHSQGD
jgi:hypothetical protein